MIFKSFRSFLASIPIAPCPGAVGNIESGKIIHLLLVMISLMNSIALLSLDSKILSIATFAITIPSEFP